MRLSLPSEGDDGDEDGEIEEEHRPKGDHKLAVLSDKDLVELSADDGDDDILDWMTMKEIWGIRMQGARVVRHFNDPPLVHTDQRTISITRERGSRPYASLFPQEYLVHLRDQQESTAEQKIPESGTYSACDGERVWSIAKRFGVSLEKLLDLNVSKYTGLQRASRLLQGTELILPPPAHLRWLATAQVCESMSLCAGAQPIFDLSCVLTESALRDWADLFAAC